MNVPNTKDLPYNTSIALMELCKKVGAQYSWNQQGGVLIETNYHKSEELIERVITMTNNMVTSYKQVTRAPRELVFGFSKLNLLIVIEEEMQVTLIFNTDIEQIDKVVRLVREFIANDLKQSAEKSPEKPAWQEDIQPIDLPELAEPTNLAEASTELQDTQSKEDSEEPAISWSTLEPEIQLLLSRVMNSAQADKLITRQIQKNTNEQGELTVDADALAYQIIDCVPHKGRRKALNSEFSDILSTFTQH
ncbi:hypothetical protein [Persicirhabdus sediminis]|uniref:Uncharacterized protein n=1 Tax=Persicirhabdus sediminis TaxID=454144 RepID=A0A8J7MES0_9BACT|nr:hypothetical protein [Persicirhabdus sediminis]MBK1790504.1 hypothetical protein [Persicirhabdus sediminis]